MTAKDVAELLQCSQQTIRRYEASGRLRGLRVGGLLRFRAEDVDALIARKEKTS
jgi:excisionase family DNA binding protein